MSGTGLTTRGTERAVGARVLVAITFHYDPSRLETLCHVLRTLAAFGVAHLHVVVVTDTADACALDRLTRLGDELFAPGGLAVAPFGSLADPKDLAWSHKSILAQTWRSAPGAFTHFIYLEGDIQLDFVNFSYWIEARETLRPYGLLPAFVRVDQHRAMVAFTATDAFWQVHVPFQAHVEADGQLFSNMPNPYNPLYILDAELVAEYIDSDSFGMDSSLTVCRWGKLERAAMGLCLERVPKEFASRYVVPVATGNRVPPFAWVAHLTGNYANSPTSPLGKIRMADLVDGAANRGAANPWSTAEALLRQAGHVEASRLYYLITDHDTVVYHDAAEGVLKHAPLGIAPLNTCAELLDRNVRLWVGDSPSWSSPLEYEMQWFLEGTISLGANGIFVGADLDGYARLNRPECLQWERYRLIRLDTLAGLSVMRRYRWSSDADPAAVVSLADQPLWLHHGGREQPSEASALAATLAPGALQHRLGLAFGPARVQPVGFDPVIRMHADDPSGSLPPHALEVRSVDGSWHRFTRVPDDAGREGAPARPGPPG